MKIERERNINYLKFKNLLYTPGYLNNWHDNSPMLPEIFNYYYKLG